MRLETKYGVLEGTVEEFRELIEGKVDLSYLSGEADCSWLEEDKSGYYIVNNDNAVCHMNSGKHVPKGLVLKHIVEDAYEDTLGVRYLLYAKDLDECNDNHIEESFKNSKRRGTLLKHNYKFKVAKEDIYSPMDNDIMIEKGTVLIKSKQHYEDSLGNTYLLLPDTVYNKLTDICDSRTGFHFEGNKRNNKLFKVGLPQNQF